MRLFWLQRLSACVLAPFVTIHLAVVLYASAGGLSAAEILSRTQGSFVWGMFYGGFVLAVAVHVPIGVRNVLRESTAWKGEGLDRAMLALSLALLALGARAVWGVIA